MADRRIVALLFAAVAVLLAACGGGGPDGGDGAAATEVSVTTTEFAFEPDAWTVAADADVAVTLTNDGTLAHEWVILSETIASEDEFDEGLVMFETEVNPNETTTATFSVPAGTYQVICIIPGHFDAGMEGQLTVQ